VSTFHTTTVLSAELLDEKAVPMGPCDNAGHPDEVPITAERDEDVAFLAVGWDGCGSLFMVTDNLFPVSRSCR